MANGGHSPDGDIRQNVDYITECNEAHGDRPLVIVTAGKSGVGKSTLINTFLELEGEDACTAAMQPYPVTPSVSSRHRVVNGVKLTVFDIPGLHAYGNNSSDDAILEELRSTMQNGKVDILFYCINITGRLDRIDWDNIDTLTRTFGKKIWNHAIFVFTWADIAELSGRSLKELLESFVSIIRHQMVDVRHINVDIRSIYSFNTSAEEQAESAEIYAYRGIVAMPVSKNPEIPQGWRTDLLVQVIRMCRLESIPLILKARHNISWWEVAKSVLASADGGAVFGTGVGAVIGAIIGGVLTAPIGGTGVVPTAAGGAILGNKIGRIIGGGGAVLFKVALAIKNRLQERL